MECRAKQTEFREVTHASAGFSVLSTGGSCINTSIPADDHLGFTEIND